MWFSFVNSCVNVCARVCAGEGCSVYSSHVQCSVFVYTYITFTIIAHKCLGMHVGTSFNAALPMELAMVR